MLGGLKQPGIKLPTQSSTVYHMYVTNEQHAQLQKKVGKTSWLMRFRNLLFEWEKNILKPLTEKPNCDPTFPVITCQYHLASLQLFLPVACDATSCGFVWIALVASIYLTIGGGGTLKRQGICLSFYQFNSIYMSIFTSYFEFLDVCPLLVYLYNIRIHWPPSIWDEIILEGLQLSYLFFGCHVTSGTLT